MTSTAGLVADTLRTAGHAESTVTGGKLTTGFAVFASGTWAIVTAVLGDDVEGHWDSPAHHDRENRMTEGHAGALKAAGWVVRAGPHGSGLVVTGRTKAA